MSLYQLFPNIQFNPIFANASPQSVDRYLPSDSLSVISYTSGDLIYSSHENQDSVGIIIEGEASIHTGISEDSVLLNTIRVGEMFGIANLYAEDKPFPTTITAKEACRVLFIDRHSFCHLIENDSTVTVNFLRLQSQKIMYLNRKIMTFTAGNAERKLSVFISEHAKDGVFTPPCSMSALANMLGIGRASLYRAIDHLIACGWMEKKGKQFYLTDHNASAELI